MKKQDYYYNLAKSIYEIIAEEGLDKDEIIATIKLHLTDAYNEGLKNGWTLSNNNIKEVLKPWFKGVHNVKII